MNAIIDHINSAGYAFVGFAAAMLIQSGLLILLLLLADFALRKRVRAVFRYWIWMLVLVKLVLPTSLSAPLSLGYWFGDEIASVDVSHSTSEAQPQAGEAPAPVLPHIIDLSKVRPPIYPPSVRPSPGETDLGPAESIALPSVPAVPITWQGVVFLLWLAIAAAMLLLLGQRAIFVRGLVAQAKNANRPMLDTLDQCRKSIKIKRAVTVKISPNATSPAVCGLWRPVILIPHNMPAALGSADLRVVLLHELAHIKRGDLWVNLIQTLLQIIYFYNPLLWLANAVIRRAREQAVDEAVLVAMGEKASQYPQTLVSVAKLVFKRPTLSLRLIGVVESKSALTARIKRILSRPIPKTAKLGILGLALIVITAAILLPMAGEKTAIGEGPEREMTLTLGWNGEKVQIPAPVAFPEWGRKTDEYKRWEKIGDARTFTTYDTEGYKYVAHALGFSTDSNGVRHATIPNVERFRPDGTLEVDTTYSPDGRPLDWRLYDKQGRKKVYAANYPGAKDQKRGVVFYGPDGKETKKWQVSEFDVVYAELVTDPNGRSYFSHYEKELIHSPYPETFVARLTNGVTVELVGVCEHPSEGKQWWKPDGDELLEVPYDEIGGNVYPDGDEKSFELAIKLRNLPAEHVNTRVRCEESVGGSAGGGSSPEKTGEYLSDFRWLATTFPKKLKACTVKVGVAAGQWQAVAASNGKGFGSRGSELGGVSFTKAFEVEDGISITVADDILGRPCRVVAITNDGEVVKPVGSSGSSAGKARQTTAKFNNISLSDIKEFQFQTRPYEWADFKNVSLRPGVKTDVQVEVEGAPDSGGAVDGTRGKAEKSYRTRYFVTLVVTDGGVRFKGRKMSWAQLEEALKKIPNRDATVLEVAVDPAIVPDGLRGSAMLKWVSQSAGFQKAAELRQDLGLEYLSNVGPDRVSSRRGPVSVRVEDALRFGEQIPVNLESFEEQPLLRTTAIEFEKAGADIRAVLKAAVTSYPKKSWEIGVRLLDGQGKQITSVVNTFENSGYAVGYAIHSQAEMNFSFGQAANLADAKRFEVKLREFTNELAAGKTDVQVGGEPLKKSPESDEPASVKTPEASAETAKQDISGFVTDENGDPIVGAVASIMNKDLVLSAKPIKFGEREHFVISAQAYGVTGSDGRFKLASLKPGRTDISIGMKGYRTEFIRDVPTGTSNLKITLREPSPYTPAGKVIDAEGNPVSGVEITLAADSFTTVQTDENGEFHFDMILEPIQTPNARQLFARKKGFGVWGKYLDTSGAETFVKITLLPETAISGRVTDEAGEPIADATVGLRSCFGKDTRFAYTAQHYQIAPKVRTGADGQFILKGMPQESIVLLHVEADQYAHGRAEGIKTGTFNGYARQIEHSGAMGTMIMGVRHEAGEMIEVKLQRAATLRGVVVYEDTNQPAAGVKVRTHSENNWAKATTGMDGRFEITGVSPESCRIIVVHKGWREGSLSEWTAPAIEINSLDPGEVKDDLKMVLTKGSIIRGRATDAKGNPLGGALIAFYSTAGPRSKGISWIHHTHTLADGSWSYRFPPGQVHAFVNTNDLGTWSKSEYTLDLKKGQVIDNIDFRLNQEVPENSPYRKMPAKKTGVQVVVENDGEKGSQFTVTPANGVTIEQPTTIRVPEDYPTLVAAVGAAEDGDTIVVSGDLYSRGEAVEGKGRSVVQGNVLDHLGEPVEGVTVELQWFAGGDVDDHNNYSASRSITDANGLYVFEDVEAGSAHIGRAFTAEDGSSSGVPYGLMFDFEIEPGKSYDITLGGKGRAVVGRLVPASGNAGDIDWSKARAYFDLRAAPMAMGFMEDNLKILRAMIKSEGGDFYRKDTVKINPDGTFRIDNVRAGRYMLRVKVPEEPKKDRFNLFRDVRIRLMRDGTSETPLNLGSLAVSHGDHKAPRHIDNHFLDSLEFDKDIPVILKAGNDEEPDVVSAKSIRFKKNGESVTAALNIEWKSIVADRWRARLTLLSENGSYVAWDDVFFETFKIIGKYPQSFEEQLNFSLGRQPDLSAIPRFTITIQPVNEELTNNVQIENITGRSGADVQVEVENDREKGSQFSVTPANGVEISARELIAEIIESEKKIKDIGLHMTCTIGALDRTFYEYDWGYEDTKEFLSGTTNTKDSRTGAYRSVKVIRAFDGKREWLFRNDPKSSRPHGGITKPNPNFSFSGGIMTFNTLLGFDAKELSRLSLGQAIAQAESVSVKEQVEFIDGRPCYVIEAINLETDPSVHWSYDVRAWIDYQRDYRPLRFEKYRSIPGKNRFKVVSRRVDNIKLEQIDGIWLPIEGARTTFSTNDIDPPKGMTAARFGALPSEERLQLGDFKLTPMGPTRKLEIDVESIRLNKGISPEAFTIAFPKGCEVYDEFAGNRHIVGEQSEKDAALSDAELIEQTKELSVSELIDVLRSKSLGLSKRRWFAVIHRLVEIGPPAVPQLVAEIRKTEQSRTQSRIALTLRAIGDLNAVAGLIDALERAGFSSDYGLGEPKTELGRFYKTYQMDPTRKGLGLGRPVREITIALERLTGHSEGHDHFQAYDSAGNRLGGYTVTPEIRDRQRQHRREVAQKWRNWWQANKDKIKPPEMPPTLPAEPKPPKPIKHEGMVLAAPEGAELTLAIVPNIGDSARQPRLTKEQYQKYLDYLAENGPFAGSVRGDSFQWSPIKGETKNYKGLPLSAYKERTYILLCARAQYVMIPEVEGKRIWGLEAVEVTRDMQGKDAISVRFDEKGAELLAKLTKANIDNHLALAVDGWVRLASVILAPLKEAAFITGDFPAGEVRTLVEDLKKGMPVVDQQAIKVMQQIAEAAEKLNKDDLAKMGPRQVVENLLVAGLAGDSERLAWFVRGESVAAKAITIDDFAQMANGHKIKVLEVHADSNDALAVTSNIKGKSGDQEGQLIFYLSKQTGTWLIHDADVGDPQRVQDDVSRFKNKHRDAKLDWSSQAVDSSQAAILAIIERLKSAKYVQSGKGTAMVVSSESTSSYQDTSGTERIVDFRFKGDLSRSDAFTCDKGKRGEFKYSWARGPMSSAQSNGRDGATVQAEPFSQFHRQVGYDFHPETFIRYQHFRLSELLERMVGQPDIVLEVTKEPKDITLIVGQAKSETSEEKLIISLINGADGVRLASWESTSRDSAETRSAARRSRLQVDWQKYAGNWYISEAISEGAGVHDGLRSEGRTTVTILDFTPNVEIEDKEFTLDGLGIRPGATVHDSVLETTYKYAGAKGDSAERLRRMGTAILMYANDYDDKVPDNVDQLKRFLDVDDMKWLLENVRYLGKGRSANAEAEIPLAYDRTMLQADQAGGTNVLFISGIVSFKTRTQLEKLGISIPPSLSWGEAVNGLRVAVEFVPDKQQYSFGEKTEVRLHIQNVSEKQIQFTSSDPVDSEAVIEDDKGRQGLAVENISSHWRIFERYHLQPGEKLVLETGCLGIISKDNEVKSPQCRWMVRARPGVYFAQFVFRLSTSGPHNTQRQPRSGEPLSLPLSENDWKGTLETGKHKLVVTGEVDRRKMTPPASGKLTAVGGKGSVVDVDPNAADVLTRYWRALEQSEWDTALSLCCEEVRKEAKKYSSPESFLEAVVPIEEILKKAGRPRTGYWPQSPKYFAYIFDVRISDPDPLRDAFWVWKVRQLEGQKKWEIAFPTIAFESWLAKEKEAIERVGKERQQQIEKLAPRLKGVQTLLSVEDQEFAIGEPVYLRLQLMNQGDSAVRYDDQQVAVNNSMTITGLDGERVRYTTSMVQTLGAPEIIKPGETKTLFDQFDISKQYDIRQPGQYRVQFNGNGLRIGVGKEDTSDLNDPTSFEYYPDILPSNVVTITIHSGIKQETLDVGKDGVEGEKAVSQTNTEDKSAVQVEGKEEVPGESVQRGDMAMHQKLKEMDRLRNGRNTPLDKVDQMVTELTAKYRHPADQGLIYYVAVGVHGMSGLYQPEKCIEYAKKAEPLLKDPARLIQLYIFWGDAIQRKHWGASGQELAAARRELAPIYLRGAKVAVDQKIPDELPQLPHRPDGGYIIGPPRPPEHISEDLPEHIRKQMEAYRKDYPAIRKRFELRRAEQRAKRDAWNSAKDLREFQEEIIFLREYARDKAIQYYAKMPFDTAEFKEMAMKILEDQEELDLLLRRLQERIKERTLRAETKKRDVQVEVRPGKLSAVTDLPDGQDEAQGNADEAKYEGRTIAEWIAQWDSKLYDETRAATEALIKIGRPAVPAMIEEIKKRSNHGWHAVGVLTKMGPEAEDAVELLIATALDKDLRFGDGRQSTTAYRGSVLSSLSRMTWARDRVIPVLQKVAEDGEEEAGVRRQVILALRGVGKGAMPILQKLTEVEERSVRDAAHGALGQLLEKEEGLSKDDYYTPLIEKDPFGPSVLQYLGNAKGIVNYGRPHPLTQKIKKLYRERLAKQPDPQLAWRLAAIIQNGLRNTDIVWAAPTGGGASQWDREDPAESYATLAEVLELGFRHAEANSELQLKFGISLAKLRLLEGDWDGMNEMLQALGQEPIPKESRQWLPAPPMDWKEGLSLRWKIADESMRSGNCSLEFRIEKDGKGLKGVHLLVKRAPEPMNGGYSGAVVDTLFFQPYPLAWRYSFGYMADDRMRTRYAVSDESGVVRFDGLPNIPIKIEVLVPTANFAEAASRWELWMEVEPGKFKIAKKYGAGAINTQEPPAVVELREGQTVHYPQLVVRPALGMNIKDFQRVNKNDFVLNWQGLDAVTLAKNVDYELEMSFSAPGVSHYSVEHAPVIKSLKQITKENQWPVGAEGVGGLHLEPGNIYMFEVRAVDKAGTVIARWPRTRLWIPWGYRQSKPPFAPFPRADPYNSPPIYEGAWWKGEFGYHDKPDETLRQKVARYLRDYPDAFEYEYVRLGKAWLDWHDGDHKRAHQQLERLRKELPRGNLVRGTAVWLLQQMDEGKPPLKRLNFVPDRESSRSKTPPPSM